MAKNCIDMRSAFDRRRMVTRDGRRVDGVSLIPDAEIWRWEVTVGDEVYRVNCNGRRYANVKDAGDIFREWKYDCIQRDREAKPYTENPRAYGRVVSVPHPSTLR